jgi:2-polyprenyl-3-methyl-5-hydroxy-6-metoxy-1,4-benzoquinol methylase
MTEAHSYSFNSDLKIWAKPFHGDFAYSDGAATEYRLLAAIRQCRDVSSTSEELRAHIVDWPSEYHLSPLRHNLLRPFRFRSTDRILELGCGCGSMTRYIGESGATVVAVEGSRRRASIAAQRCRDLPNVSIYCDNLTEFETDQRFDIVTLIGVLEYSPMFIQAEDPVQACIEKARSFLKDGGTLILAIENQLGLKYFNGCGEDHTGVPYFGINGLYGANTPVTFGRKELQSRLKVSGFDHLGFFYPFPDYKLPDVILSDEAFNREGFRSADMLQNLFSRDYGSNQHRAFHENLVWQTLERNSLIPDLANSFLVLASDSDSAFIKHDWLASAYSTARGAAYATETIFKDKDDAIAVEKRLVYPGQSRPISSGTHRFYHDPAPCCAYVSGRLLVTELQAMMGRGARLDDVIQWTSSWMDHLLSKAVRTDGVLMLPGEMLDAIPTNLVRDVNGSLADIDSEWRVDGPIPFFWVVARGLAMSLRTCPNSEALAKITLNELVLQVLAHSGLSVSETDHQAAIAYEDALQETVFAARRNPVTLSETLTKPISDIAAPPRAVEAIAYFRNELLRTQLEIERIKSGWSWKITKPFRDVVSVAKKVKEKLVTKNDRLGDR